MINKYTLITGASEGFGKALAFECAAKKMNLILVALPGPELYNLANYIKRNYEIHVIAIAKDLCNETECTELFEEVATMNLHVNVLINNAGLGGTMLFNEGTVQFFQKQIRLNVMATTQLTHLFLETLRRNAPSYVLNVASMNSFFYLVKKQVYGATKSYIYSFSKSLHRELKSEGIQVSVVCPGGMNTSIPIMLLNKAARWLTRLPIMNPEDVAKITIHQMLRGKMVIIPGKVNRVLLVFDKLMPESMKSRITDHQMKKMKAIAHPMEAEAV